MTISDLTDPRMLQLVASLWLRGACVAALTEMTVETRVTL